jgi:branched-chain amino acid transport system substrate-binding protein
VIIYATESLPSGMHREEERVAMSRPRWVAFVAVLGVCMLAAAGCANKDNGGGGGAQSANCSADQFGCLTVGSGEPIKIGTLLAISGDTRTLGLDSQRGVILAVDYLDGKLDGKPGQLMGHNVELVNTDETCSKEGGQAGATKLAADPKILSVIGTSCSSAALGVADTIFSKKGILLISPSNTGPALTAEGQHQPFYLRTAHNDKIQGAVVADFAYQKLGAKTAATINDGSPYADGLAAVFRQVFEKLGGKITNNEAIQPTDRDFKPVLNSISQNKPDFLYYPDFSPACGLIAKQAQDIPALSKTALAGSDGCANPDYIKVGGKATYGTWSSGPDIAAQTSRNAFYGQQFLPAYQKQFGERPIAVFNAHAYDAFNILAEAIKRAATDDGGTLTIPRTKLKDEIFKTSNYNGLSGTLSCNPLGDCATSASIAIYKVPEWPIEGGTANPKPVFTETKTLQEASAS